MSLCRQSLLVAVSVATVVIAMPLMGSTASRPAVIFVDDDNCPGPGSGSEADPYCSIQDAIDAAVDGDEVVVADGVYIGPRNVNLDFGGKLITVRSATGDPALCVIDCQNTPNTRGFYFHSGEAAAAVVKGFTIANGNALMVNTSGGGMRNDNSNPTVINCIFSGNQALFGGGMRNDNSNPTVINCVFVGNTASLGGGMLNLNSNPTVTGCTFSLNTASTGGGMRNDRSDPVVVNCTFSNNTAPSGGATFNQGQSSPTLINCNFSGNTATNAGGMFNSNSSSPTVINCTFTGNIATNIGGGMWNANSSSPTMTNCTFSGNTAAAGGGGLVNWRDSSPTVTNCTFWGNGPNEIVDVFGAVTTVLYSDVQGGFSGIGNIDADPMFVDPDNGDYRISPGSPCIDAGDNTAVPLEIDTDLDGNTRFVDDPDTPDTGNGTPPIVDMGAYEFQLPCPWDLNADGQVSVPDLLELIASFGPCEGNCPADFDGDGVVGVPDLLALIGNFGPCPGSECVWDLNGDGFVDNDDLQQVLANQGPCGGCPEDVNGDGVVDGQDVAAVATHFGACP